MKKVFNTVKYALYPAAGILLLALVFSACKKNDVNNKPAPVAQLMVFNLSLDKGAVGVTLSGNNLINVPLGYTNYTGGYLPVYIGSREVKSFDVNSAGSLATSTQLFTDSSYYSLFVVSNNKIYRNIITNDSLNKLVPVTGQAFVRYINAIPDSTSPLVTISSNGSTIISANTPFSSVSRFTKVNTGNIIIGVNNGSTIAANRTIAVEDSKAYTILLTGIPGAVDTTKSVQIKFITNGKITP